MAERLDYSKLREETDIRSLKEPELKALVARLAPIANKRIKRISDLEMERGFTPYALDKYRGKYGVKFGLTYQEAGKRVAIPQQGLRHQLKFLLNFLDLKSSEARGALKIEEYQVEYTHTFNKDERNDMWHLFNEFREQHPSWDSFQLREVFQEKYSLSADTKTNRETILKEMDPLHAEQTKDKEAEKTKVERNIDSTKPRKGF